MRKAEIKRKTKETEIELVLNLDGGGKKSIVTGIGFLNHMLELFAVHSGVDLNIKCKGDTDVDFHHSAEDVGICLGQAFKQALGDKKGIARFADRIVPMDESAALCAIDISGRPHLNFISKMKGKTGDFDAELIEEFFNAFCVNAGVNLYIEILRGGNLHHEAEAIFKAFAKAVQDAVKIVSDKIPSSKGIL